MTFAFEDKRWVGGTWDYAQFKGADGETDWDAVIDAEVRRRKLLELAPVGSSNDEKVVFDTSEVPWTAWVKRFHLKEAELLNGRAAMVGFLAGTGAVFVEGDVLTQLAKHPLWTLGVVAAIAQAQVITAEQPAGTTMIPDSVKRPVLDAYVSMGGEKFFSSEAEKANGRAAMIGMLILLFFGALF